MHTPHQPGHTGADAARRPQGPAVAQLIALRSALMRHARGKVREPEVAQDLVQDTLEDALRGLSAFEGRSSLATWTFSILRHHIADHHRRHQRCVSLSSLLDDEAETGDELDKLIDTHGLWRDAAPAADAATPEANLVRQQFWSQVELGMASLTTAQAQVFRLRDLLDQDAAQVSAVLGMSANHCHVTLHRARAKLRVFMRSTATTQHPGQASPR